MKKTRCVIVGGGGFIGRHLARRLAFDGHEVVVCDRNGELSFPDTDIQCVQFDITDLEKAKKLIKKGDYIFNLASPSVPYTSMLHPFEELSSHTEPHINFMNLVFKTGIEKVIFFSSGGSVYGMRPPNPVTEETPPNPVSPYAISKLTIEYYMKYFSRIYKTPSIIYRLSNPYGPGQKQRAGFGVVPAFFSHVRKGTSPVVFNNGLAVRDFIYIDDVIEAVSLSFQRNTKFSLYNLGSGKGTKIITLWNLIQEISNKKIAPEFKEKRLIDADAIVLDISRFTSEFGWKPKTTLEEGIERMHKTSSAREIFEKPIKKVK